MPSDRWRERVEKVAGPHRHSGISCDSLCPWQMRVKDILALVEEAEREALERAAKVVEDHVIGSSGEHGHYLKHETRMGRNDIGRAIYADAIRALAQSKEKTASARLNQYPLSVVAEACTPKMEKTDGE